MKNETSRRSGAFWPRRLGTLFGTALVSLVIGAGAVYAQVVVGTLDDFQSGTTQGWVANLSIGIPPVPPSVVADAGPEGLGDSVLRVTGTGSPLGAGGKLVVNNVDARWTGDFPSAGVVGVLVDVANPNPFPLRLRLGISEPLGVAVGGRWVTQSIFVPPSSSWVTLEYSLAPENLLPGELVAPNVDVTLANVGIIRILHSNATAFAGEAIAGQLDIDNVETVPEPGIGLGMLFGSAWLAGRRGGRRRA